MFPLSTPPRRSSSPILTVPAACSAPHAATITQAPTRRKPQCTACLDAGEEPDLPGISSDVALPTAINGPRAAFPPPAAPQILAPILYERSPSAAGDKTAKRQTSFGDDGTAAAAKMVQRAAAVPGA